MKSKLISLSERMNAVSSKGGETMWYLAFGDIILEMFKEQPSISREEVKAKLEDLAAEETDMLMKSMYAEAAKQLAFRTGKA